MDINVEGVT